MKELRDLFIHCLTNDTGEYATAVFTADGKPLWRKITLDMILTNFDKAVEELKK